MESQLQTLLADLLARGVAVTVVSRTLDLPAHPLLSWHRVPGPARPFVLAYPWFGLVASTIVARHRRGIVHVTGAIVLNRADVCTVHYLHNRRGTRIDRARRATTLYRLNERIGGLMARAFEHIVLGARRRSATVVAVSEPLAVDIAHAFPQRRGDVRVIRNAVDSDRFQPSVPARQDVRRQLDIGDQFVALFVGSDWPRKGLAVAVESIALEPLTTLVVVGRGDAHAIERQARKLGVSDRLRLVGESAEPERFYAAADVLVLPSAYETFLLAAFEAAAAGLPVIATDVGAVAELARRGAATIVDRDASSVAAALERLRTDNDLREAMGRAGRGAALAYSGKLMVDEYVALYGGDGPQKTQHRPLTPVEPLEARS